jgi:hypothetical protein
VLSQGVIKSGFPDISTFLSGHTGDPGVQLGFQPSEVTFLQEPFALDTHSKKLKEVLDER